MLTHAPTGSILHALGQVGDTNGFGGATPDQRRSAANSPLKPTMPLSVERADAQSSDTALPASLKASSSEVKKKAKQR